ncbi:hypothetical protein A6R68_01500 [Neotoma lepida]|uniref:Uncharacterized protein n=1 Tax=Neotoma lepida TaxID=56216 RepID=A0A1A6GVJ1_NEOLE|nr:hypothetical protein A6R68_01500 [Neotoma lepida]
MNPGSSSSTHSPIEVPWILPTYLLSIDIAAISDPFINLNCKIYKFHYDSTHIKFHSTVEAENGKLVNGKAISIFQE